MRVREALAAAGIEPREARLLLAAATGLSEASVVAFPERALTTEDAERFSEFLSRRRKGEPVAYILGHKEFYGIDLVVTPAVLIPRPETELLVELALTQEFFSAADLGTGSGAIALALKKCRPVARVVAVEASAAALVVAQRNAARLNLDVEFRHGRWCDPLPLAGFDLIVANPPYVAEGDAHLAALAFEPPGALVGGPDGLACLRELCACAPACLRPGGRLLLEHGAGQDNAVRQLLSGSLENVQTWPDLAGMPRVTGGVKS